jgi:hypothetical protein
MRRTVIARLLAAGATLAGAASAEAQPLAGGNYLGSYAGGTVKLEVSDDGRGLERFQVTTAQGGVCTAWSAAGRFGTTPIPIENDRFNASPFPTLSITGFFAAPNTAQGTFDLGPYAGSYRGQPRNCPRGLVSWTAVGDADPPVLVLNAPEGQSSQKKGIRVNVSCLGEPCDVSFQGVVSLKARGSTKRYRLWSRAADNVQGTTAVTLTIPLHAHKAIRALGEGRFTAKVKATAIDHFGNAASSERTIRLVP